jgi:hypothetical protein
MKELHKVRLLCRCPVCGKLGDEQAMVKVGPMKTPAHDRCAFEQLGEGIVNLPKEERAKFTLAVVGPAVMRITLGNDQPCLVLAASSNGRRPKLQRLPHRRRSV